MSAIIAFAFAIATGFVTAGVVSNLYAIITRKPVSFAVLQETVMGQVAGVLTLVFAGPTVIMRNALRGQVVENRPPLWFGVSLTLASIWSFFVGIFVLNLWLSL